MGSSQTSVRHPILALSQARVEIAGWQTMETHWHQPRRTLEVHDLIHVETGRGQVGMGKRTYSLQPGSWALLPAGIPHWLSQDADSPLTLGVIHFSIQPESANSMIQSLPEPGAIQVQENARAVAAMHWAIDYFLDPDLQTQFLADRCLDLTLALILNESLLGWIPDARLSKALNRIHQSPGDSLSLPSLARYVGLSPYHFRDLFIKHLGVSPSRYIRKLRILLARDLLRNTDQTMQEIAHASGWENASTFVRTFEKETGQTPGRYRTITREMSG